MCPVLTWTFYNYNHPLSQISPSLVKPCKPSPPGSSTVLFFCIFPNYCARPWAMLYARLCLLNCCWWCRCCTWSTGSSPRVPQPYQSWTSPGSSSDIPSSTQRTTMLFLRGQLIVTRGHLIADRDQLIVIGWYSRPGILKSSADSQQRSFRLACRQQKSADVLEGSADSQQRSAGFLELSC